MPNTPGPIPHEPPQRRSAFGTTFLALIGCAVAAAVLLALPTGFIGPVIVFGGLMFIAIIGMHYVIWGRWLTKIIQEEQADDKER